MAEQPILDEELWVGLGGRPSRRPNPRQVVLTRARNRRWAVVIGALSFALLLFALVLLSVDLHDASNVCGSALSPTGSTDRCEDSVRLQRVWVVLATALSAGLAAGAFRLRWGPAWQEVRLQDLDEPT